MRQARKSSGSIMPFRFYSWGAGVRLQPRSPPPSQPPSPLPHRVRPLLTRSKWLKDARNSLSCSWLRPLASRVSTWFSTSLMVRAMEVSSCSQPTRMCCESRKQSESVGSQCHELWLHPQFTIWPWASPPPCWAPLGGSTEWHPAALPAIKFDDLLRIDQPAMATPGFPAAPPSPRS